MLHPGLADVYRRKVEKLTEALNKEELRAEAAEMLRSTIQTDPARARGRGVGDRACGRACEDSGAEQ
jgi:hypothetical protein